MEHMQLEFPFTMNGALYAYNNAKKSVIDRDYDYYTRFKHIDNKEYITYNDFTAKWIECGNSERFHNTYINLFLGQAVEFDNESVLKDWKSNDFETLEDKVLE